MDQPTSHTNINQPDTNHVPTFDNLDANLEFPYTITSRLVLDTSHLTTRGKKRKFEYDSFADVEKSLNEELFAIEQRAIRTEEEVEEVIQRYVDCLNNRNDESPWHHFVCVTVLYKINFIRESQHPPKNTVYFYHSYGKF
jgi:hypothetical protein